MKDCRPIIASVVLDIQERNGYKPVEPQDGSAIVKDLGFSSLDIAELIATLEIELGVDPFADGVPIADVRTLGELSGVYAAALAQQLPESA